MYYRDRVFVMFILISRMHFVDIIYHMKNYKSLMIQNFAGEHASIKIVQETLYNSI